MATQLAFHYDQSACTGCKACQIACKDKNDLEVGTLWRRVVEVQGGDWVRQGSIWGNNLSTYHLSIASARRSARRRPSPSVTTASS